jgi:proline iminopeptidase
MAAKSGWFKRGKLLKRGKVPVGNGQHMAYQLAGNPKGMPVVYLHGGPGGEGSLKYTRMFDSKKWLVIVPDQRGCGLSTPQGTTTDNDTYKLVEDLELLREKLGIPDWVVSGGSWGSTLALKYAQSYPQRVKGLLLRAVFLARSEDEAWLFEADGARQFFPDIWDRACEISDVNQDEGTLQEVWQLAFSEKLAEQQRAAAFVANWEGTLLKLRAQANFRQPESFDQTEIDYARIFFHYQKHKFFLAENELLDNANVIANIPTEIVHARYDMVCPLAQAVALADALKQATLHIADLAGHSGSEPNVLRQGSLASESLYHRLR